MLEQLFPRSVDLGDDVDDAGKLSNYHQHRIAEAAIADRFLRVAVPRARELQRWEDADRMFKRAGKMLACRQRGPCGLNTDGNVVVAWEEKCSLTKYCPDESQHEAKRLAEIYMPAIHEHRRQGGRVYKAWFTIPNYPGGRLREGLRHLPKRFRNRIMRTVKNGEQAFGIDGALIIVEAPLSRDRDWNVHLNVILLTRDWLDYKALRAQWAFNVEIKQHTQFDDGGMADLFNEMIKYSVAALPEKSNDDKHRNKAPAMIEWTADELIEWDTAMNGYRRTRGYGSLHGLGKPDVTPAKVLRWLGYIRYKSHGYELTRRAHDLPLHRAMLLASNHPALDLIRGNKSTTTNRPRGPP